MVDRQVAPRRDGKGRWLERGRGGLIVPKSREDFFLYRLREAITMEDWDDIVTMAVSQAKEGDRFARKWLSDLAVGPPAQVHEHLSMQQQEVNITVVYDERPKEKPIDTETIDHDDLRLD